MKKTSITDNAVKDSTAQKIRSKIMLSLKQARRSTKILTAALALQLILAGGLFVQSRLSADFSTTGKLVTFDKDVVDEILINDGEGDISLSRTDNGWQLDNSQSLPADAARVDTLVETLADLSPGLPVANTVSSQAQLEVADDKFQRHLVLKSSNTTLTDMYLGSSPGFRKAHLRLAGEDAIHAAKINVFDLPTKPDDWLDKTLIAFSDVTALASADFKLQKSDDTWTVIEPTEIPENFELDTTAITSFVSFLESIRVTGLAQPIEVPEIDIEEDTKAESADDSTSSDTEESDADEQSEETLTTETLTITSGGKEITLTVQQLGDKTNAKRSDIDTEFSVPANLIEQLTGLNTDNLFVVVEETSDAEDEKDEVDTDTEETNE